MTTTASLTTWNSSFPRPGNTGGRCCRHYLPGTRPEQERAPLWRVTRVSYQGDSTMRIILTAAALTLAAPLAFAQSDSQYSPQGAPQNAPVKGMHENNSTSPVKGANSFTRDQARKQIEAKGYT